MKRKFVYDFSEGNAKMRFTLGGKGANLAEMTNLGIPVPPGFTVTTEACLEYISRGENFLDEIKTEVLSHLESLENEMGKKFGDTKNPLLVSVRSGAKISMPGMMDTVLNLGLNDKTVEGFGKKIKNMRSAYDSYRRFINMFGDVVLGIPHEKFEEKMDEIKTKKGVKNDTELSEKDLKQLSESYKKVIYNEGIDFPEDPIDQLFLSIKAVFESWNSPRAFTYRKLHDISHTLGTAVNIQTMVFGNTGNKSGTGVAFTRNPSTGEKKFYGEFLLNAQGEDVVAGIRTPESIDNLKSKIPAAFEKLNEIQEKLENHFREMQDLEFTIENERLFLLQTRNGKRTAKAATKIAVDMVKENLISEKEAILRIDPKSIDSLLHPTIDTQNKKEVIAKGLPASPGAAFGKVVFSADDAYEWSEKGEKVILVRRETSPDDIHGMHAAEGILTSFGGMTSHAAVICRGMGKCCVAGCSEVNVNKKKKKLTIGKSVLKEGETITLDGSTGNVYIGKIETKKPEISKDFKKILSWSDKFKKIAIRTNADTPTDSKIARDFGAEGIGLCRTEHMFFEEGRAKVVQEMIIAGDKETRERALQKLLPMQKNDFLEIFKAMNSFPVTIRLLDPPLHEFLPEKDEDIKELAKTLKIKEEKVKDTILSLSEVNPMLGHRGCRLAISYPEIAKMQVRAIIEAAIEVKKEGGEVIPEIMVPLVGILKEFEKIKSIIEETIQKVFKEKKSKIDYKIGTMIELPRACTIADNIAKVADFFSFGTNDLTQMTFGYSRDDVGKFLSKYIDDGILEKDPFASLDTEGVGSLIKMAISKAKSVKNKIKIGVCGEHGGDPDSIKFFVNNGFNYVSCSPFRVAIARISAAQSEILKNQKTEN